MVVCLEVKEKKEKMKKIINLLLIIIVNLSLSSQLLTQALVSQPKDVTQGQLKEQPVDKVDKKVFKFLNARYGQIKLTIEDPDGKKVGDVWILPVSLPTQKPQPLIYSGEIISLTPEHKIKIVTQKGFQLQRYAFELDVDPADNSYVWILK